MKMKITLDQLKPVIDGKLVELEKKRNGKNDEQIEELMERCLFYLKIRQTYGGSREVNLNMYEIMDFMPDSLD